MSSRGSTEEEVEEEGGGGTSQEDGSGVSYPLIKPSIIMMAPLPREELLSSLLIWWTFLCGREEAEGEDTGVTWGAGWGVNFLVATV